MRPIASRICQFLTLFSILYFSSARIVVGQVKWTLDDCIKQAISANISIKRTDLQADHTKNALQSAKASRYPIFNGWASHNLSSGKTVNYEDYSYINREYQDGNLGVQGQVDLFSGFSISNSIKEQKWAFQAALEETEQLKNSVTLQVTSAFLQVIFAAELLEVAKAQYAISRQQVDNTKVFVEMGTMAQSNLLEMEALAASDGYTLTQAESQLRNARLELTQLMNYEGSDSLEFIFSRPANPELIDLPDPQVVYGSAVNQLPQIKSASYLLKSSEYGLAAAKGYLSPNLGMNGLFYSRYSELGVNPLDPSAYYPYTEQIGDNSYGRVSINLNIPIFNQRQNVHRVNQARIQNLDAQYALDEAKIELKNVIEKGFNDAKNALAKYQAASKALESIQLSHEYIQAKFEGGLATITEYNLSKTQLIKTKSDLIQAKFEFILRAKILDFYRGLPIDI